MITWKEFDGWSMAYDQDGLQVAKVYADKSYAEVCVLGGSKIHYDSRENAKRGVETRLNAIEEQRKNPAHSMGDETPRRKNMLKEITDDAKAFMHDNRNILYWLALAFLADHFFFNGTFRERLNAMVEKMIGKVEKQLEAAK